MKNGGITVAKWHKNGSGIRDAQNAFLLQRYISFWLFFGLGFAFAAVCYSSHGERLRLHLPVTLLPFTALSASPLLPLQEHGLSVLCAAAWRAAPIPVIMLLGLRDYHYFVLSDFWNFIFCSPHGMLAYYACRCFSACVAQSPLRLIVLCALCFVAVASIVVAHSRLLTVNRVAITGLAIPCLHPRNGQRYKNEAERESMKLRAIRYLHVAVGETAIVFILEVILTLIGYLLCLVSGIY
jgi:hypothetical protein